jgi:RNA polymerase sigma factor (sigma-70 family)
VDQTVDGDVQPDTFTERGVTATTRGPMVHHQHTSAAAAKTQPAGPSTTQPNGHSNGQPAGQDTPPPEAESDQVVVGDIPPEPPGFVSRDGLLAKLDPAQGRVLALYPATGLLGLGTTQLAAAYARAKLADGWRLVGWVNAAETGSLQAGLAAAAEATGLADAGSDRKADVADAGQAVRHLLETDGDRCLLVFDDVADPELLRPFVPADGRAQVLITSTRPPAAELATAVPVDAFSADEALSFLTGRAGLDDEAGAAAVAAALEHLPLALALAAPVIRGQRHGYVRYLDRLQTIPTEVFLTGDDGQPYPQGVARAVSLSLAAVRSADKTGMCTRVIEIMAVLSAAGVRRELLHVLGRAGVLAGGGHRVEATLVDRALDWLSDRSLLTFSLDGQTVVMHRLVAHMVRDGLVRRRRFGAVCWVAASVLEAHAIAVAGSQDRAAVRGIPQQVTALLEHTAKLGREADGELAELLLRLRFIALYHLVELDNRAPQAIEVGEELTGDLERRLGPGHIDTLNARNSLAAAYLAAGRVADAIPLFEQTLVVLQRDVGPDHPDTLTLQNNLATAYRDADRLAEAIPLYEQNLAVREQQPGPDHPSTLNSRGNLAAAYLAAGRVADAIPLLEQTLAGRDQVLGSDHPDTQTSRKNLAQAYRAAGRFADAIPLEEALAGRRQVLGPDHAEARTARKNLPAAYRDGSQVTQAIPRVEPAPSAPAAREREALADDATQVLPVGGFRRPPTDAARPAVPAGFRRPPADPAGRLLAGRGAGTSAEPSDHSFPSWTHDLPPVDAEQERQMVAAITAGDPAGIGRAFDRYAAALYGYCHWMLHGSADAAESVQDTFVLAAATLDELPEPAQLRPWLFSLARNECKRRIRPTSLTRDEADAADQRADEGQPADAGQGPQADAGAGLRTDKAARPDDVTTQFVAIGSSIGETDDATMLIPVYTQPDDATMLFRRPVIEPIEESADQTTQFVAISDSIDSIDELPADATRPFYMVSQLADATTQFRVVSEPARAPATDDDLADVTGYLGQAELRTLIRATMADLKPREREVIELSFRHDLDDDELAIVLGISPRRARALAGRARVRLEKSFGAMRTALAGREACPVVGELLADWDGELTEQTRDLVAWHIEQCQTCANSGRGALRPTALSGLLPLAPLPAELRAEVMSCCFAPDHAAVAHRRRVVRRAKATWRPLFSRTVRWLSWESIRANPGAAIAATAVALWLAAAVVVTLLTFAGSHDAHAQVLQPSSRPSPGRSATASASTNGRASTEATRSPTVSRSPVRLLPSPSYSAPLSPAPTPALPPSPKPSKSAKPTRSPSPTPSTSAKPSPKPPPKPSKSPSPSPSPSSSTTATPGRRLV